jgi:hypothetical protein
VATGRPTASEWTENLRSHVSLILTRYLLLRLQHTKLPGQALNIDILLDYVITSIVDHVILAKVQRAANTARLAQLKKRPQEEA